MIDTLCFEDQLRIEGVKFKGFGILPKYVMLDRDLTIEAKTIYAYFCSFAGNGNSTFPGRDKILTDLPMSKDAYYKHFKLLTEQGYVHVQQQKKIKNIFSNNIYTLVSNPKKFKDKPNDCCDGPSYSQIRFSGLKSVGYGMIPKAVMIDSRLPVKAKGIYAYFCSFTGAGNNAFPQKDLILLHLQISEKTYYKFYKLLTDLNYITVVQRHVNGRLQVNDYFLNDTPDAAIAGKKTISICSFQDGKKQDAVKLQVSKKQDTEKQDTVSFQDGKIQDAVNLQDSKIQDTASIEQVRKKQDTEKQDTQLQDGKIQDTNINSLTNNNVININSLNQQSKPGGSELTYGLSPVFHRESEGERERKKEFVIDLILKEKKLPYVFAQDQDDNIEAMTTAIHFMTYWDTFYPKGYEDELQQHVYNLFNQALIEMCCCTRTMTFKGAMVSYSKIIDGVNYNARFGETFVDLSELSEPAMENYLRGSYLSEIRNPLQYMKSCIWDAMQTGNIAYYEDMRRFGM